jgi:hypothetical protein
MDWQAIRTGALPGALPGKPHGRPFLNLPDAALIKTKQPILNLPISCYLCSKLKRLGHEHASSARPYTLPAQPGSVSKLRWKENSYRTHTMWNGA